MRGTAIEERIRELALSFPESYEDRPWGDFPVFKVGANKVFAWLTIEPKAVQLTLKLTAEERDVAHLLPWVSVARYVGRYGWVTATVTDADSLDAALEGLRESYWLKAPAAVREAAWPNLPEDRPGRPPASPPGPVPATPRALRFDRPREYPDPT